jgi:altronate dehydratase large subunit
MSVEEGDLSDASFTGFRRPDGRTGVRNRVLALPSVICSHIVAEEIADRVDSVVAAPHDHGCGQLGVDNSQTAVVLEGVAANPNVAGTVVVGLGCEEVQSGDVAAAIRRRGLPVEELAIQDEGGTDACVEAGVTATSDLVNAVEANRSTSGSLADLTIGLVGDLEQSTVETVDPVLGSLVDRVVAAGGSVLLAGSERFVPHPAETKARVRAESDDVERFFERHAGQPSRASRSATVAASSDFETVVGIIGDAAIEEIVPYGQQPSLESGVGLVDAPSRFEEAATALAAAGAHVVVHATAHGEPAGHPIVPVLKVSGDGTSVAAMPDAIDVDATEASRGDLVRRVLATAAGTRVCAERHGLTEFAITRVGPSM